MELVELETLAYVSRATPGLGLRDLKHVLRRSREHNFRAGVTGYLVYDGAWFAQLLEGPAPALDSALARIEADPRHREVRLLLRQPIDRRCFDGWSMGCTNLAAPVDMDTSELRGLIHDFVDDRDPSLDEVQAFFRTFTEFRSPEQTSRLSL
jgi:hypothetical protein